MAGFAIGAADEVEDALDPGEARLRRRTRLALLLIGALVVALFLLSVVIRISGAVIGIGEVAVESRVKTITHSSGGILAAVLVRDGDRVREGQELLRFDTSVSAVGSASAASSLEQLLARRARLQAERDGAATLSFPAELRSRTDAAARDVMVRERRLFDLRRQQQSGSLALLRERVEQFEQQIGGHEAQIRAIDDQAKLIGPELDGLRKLYERKLVTLGRINELERTAVQLAGSRAALTSTIAEARARIAETREQMLNLDKQRRSEAGTELAEVLALSNDQQVRAASAGDAHTRSVIRAPQGGVVDKLTYTTVGSAVPPNQPILEIVPDRDTLIVTARVRPSDVDQLRVGQPARVTFSGLDRQTTPDIAGTLVFVSADLTSDQRTGESYYRIRIRLDPKAMEAASQLALKAGMPAEVYVQTGNRSILSFIMKPLFDQFGRAFREG